MTMIPDLGQTRDTGLG